jgi:tyrosyl-tRNA synthetase
VLPTYLLLASDLHADQVHHAIQSLERGEVNPSVIKRALARDLVRQYHDQGSAAAAEAQFDRIFVRHEAPEDMPTFAVPRGASIVQVLVASGLASSNGDARRLIRQGAVVLRDRRVEDERELLEDGVLKVGKRRFLRLVRSP